MENETSPLEHDGSGPDAAPRLPTVSMPVGSGATDADRFLSAPVNVLVVADAPPPPLPPPPLPLPLPPPAPSPASPPAPAPTPLTPVKEAPQRKCPECSKIFK